MYLPVLAVSRMSLGQVTHCLPFMDLGPSDLGGSTGRQVLDPPHMREDIDHPQPDFATSNPQAMQNTTVKVQERVGPRDTAPQPLSLEAS